MTTFIIKFLYVALVIISNVFALDTLQSVANKHTLTIGSAISENNLGNTKYMKIIQEQYGDVTAENSCKFYATEPKPNIFTYTNCDKVSNVKQGIKFRGHTLVWGNQNPSWVKSITSRQILEDAMNNHIKNVITYYGTRTFAWDVVNEALSDNSGEIFKKNIWYPVIPNYVDQAFIQANLVRSKGVKLFYNDYNTESTSQKKADKQYDMVKSMLLRGIPIDGVGIQMHIDMYNSDAVNIKDNMDRLGALGLEVHITEIDVSCSRYRQSCSKWTEVEKNIQAQTYAAMMQACLDSRNCTLFQTWGVSDNYSWLGLSNHPLLFDENYEAKPAYYAIIDTLNGNLKWVNEYYKRIGKVYKPPTSITTKQTTTSSTTPSPKQTTTSSTTPFPKQTQKPVGLYGKCLKYHNCKPGLTCYEKDYTYAQCNISCKVGIQPNDPVPTPWSCKVLV